MSQVTLTLKKMEKFMWIYIIAWNGWFIPLIAMKGFEFLDNSQIKIAVQVITVLFAVLWTIYLVRLGMLTKEVNKNEVLKNAFSDDFMVNAKLQSANWGFFGAIAAAVLMSVISKIFDLGANVALDIVILLSVNAYLVSYLITLKKGDSSE